jgi:hypothetical protein
MGSIAAKQRLMLSSPQGVHSQTCYAFFTTNFLVTKSFTRRALIIGNINRDNKTISAPPPSNKPASVFLRGVTNIIAKIETKVNGPDKTTTKNIPSLLSLCS